MKKLLILSGKGGTGKTTTAAAFIHLSQARAFADCDVDAPNLHLVETLAGEPRQKDYLGGDKAKIDPRQCIGCSQCMTVCRFGAIDMTDEGKCVVSPYACEGCGVCADQCPMRAISLVPDVSGFQSLYTGEKVFSTATLKMGRGNSGKLVSAVKLDLLKNAPDTDLAIIDGAPGIGCPVIASISGVDQVLVVTEPSLSGLSDLSRLLQTAEGFAVPAAVAVNRWDLCPEQCAAIEDYCREHHTPFVGKIPYDQAAAEAINAGRSVAELDCPAAQALGEIFQRVMALMGLNQ